MVNDPGDKSVRELLSDIRVELAEMRREQVWTRWIVAGLASAYLLPKVGPPVAVGMSGLQAGVELVRLVT